MLYIAYRGTFTTLNFTKLLTDTSSFDSTKKQ